VGIVRVSVMCEVIKAIQYTLLEEVQNTSQTSHDKHHDVTTNQTAHNTQNKTRQYKPHKHSTKTTSLAILLAQRVYFNA
jgi:hypothetical protein